MKKGARGAGGRGGAGGGGELRGFPERSMREGEIWTYVCEMGAAGGGFPTS